MPALGVVVTDNASAAVASCRVAIDFTLPAAMPQNVAACVAAEAAMDLKKVRLVSRSSMAEI
jgi:dihydrodipicolinate reductase